MLLSGHGFSDSGAIWAFRTSRERLTDLSDPLAMLKLVRWAALGLVSVGVAQFLIEAGYKRSEGTGTAAYTDGLADLAAHERGGREIEARVTGGFGFAPYRPGWKQAGREAAQDRTRILRGVETDASPESLGAAAVILLLDRSPDRAGALLRKALAGGAQDPRLLSDLSAAHLVQAELKGTPYDLIQALAAADRALEIAPDLTEARFNQALLLTRLGLAPDAEKAWNAYLDLDRDSGWSEEARGQLQRLGQPPEAALWTRDRDRLDQAALAGDTEEVRLLVASYRQPARLYVEDQLLGDWAVARTAGRAEEESTRPLTIARAVADALGYSMLRAEVGAVEEAMQASNGRLAALIRGHAAYARARAYHEDQKYAEAEPLFRQAAAALQEGRSTFAAWPDFYLAVIAYHHGDRPKAIRDLEALRQRFARWDYPPLLGYFDWIIGQARGAQGPIAAALPASAAALQEFQRAGEVENQAALHSILAQIYDNAGDLDRAWTHHLSALQALPRLYKPRRVQNILTAVLHTLRKTGDLRPAVHFQEVFIDQARRAGKPGGLSIALRDQAVLLHELGRDDEALSRLDEAQTAIRPLPDPKLRQVEEVAALVAAGKILRANHPDAALQSLDEALAISLQEGNRHLLIEILQERAESWLTLGRDEEAERDLEAGLAELERQRRIVQDGSLRIFFADQGRALLEERIALQRRRGESPDVTFDTAEQLRARALLDAVGSPGTAGWPEPRSADEITAALPADTALVEYLWVRGDLLAWVITRDGTDLVDLGSGRERIEDLAERFLRALRNGREAGEVSSALHRALIRPLEDRLAATSTLIIVPDGVLCQISFAALQDEPGHRFLIEDYRLAASPSASVYVALSERYQERSRSAPASILLVGEPRFDRGLFSLPSLPATAREIENLERLYGRSVVLTGEAATAERFLAALPDQDVLHFAGHTVTAPGAEAPSLLLTPSELTGDAGLLPASGIRSPRPPWARLAVLAGCRTAEGRLSRNEGTLGLARAFLASGIPAVVASLWDTEDRPTSHLLTRFHERFRAGADPLTALQQAQLDLLRGPDRALASSRAWAAFQVFGGSFASAGDLPPPGSTSY